MLSLQKRKNLHKQVCTPKVDNFGRNSSGLDLFTSQQKASVATSFGLQLHPFLEFNYIRFFPRCNKNDCKRKELIPFRCDYCQMSYCIKHRHTSDHDCRAKAASQTMSSQLCARAAETRIQSITTKKDTKTKPATTCGAQQRAQR